MDSLNRLKKNKENIFLYIVIIIFIFIFIVGIIVFYRYSKKSNKNNIIKSNILNKNEIIQVDVDTIDFSGNFGIHINKESDKININEYMSEENELISQNKKYKVKFANGNISLIHIISGKRLRSLESNVFYQFIKKEKYLYTDTDKKIINNGLIFITKNKINTTTPYYNIKLTILNKDGKIFDVGYLGNEKSNGYLKLDDCGNLILYVDDKEKLDVFNLVEL
jgi:hypothetical protein